jgi:hypothetical protein
MVDGSVVPGIVIKAVPLDWQYATPSGTDLSAQQIVVFDRYCKGDSLTHAEVLTHIEPAHFFEETFKYRILGPKGKEKN